MPHIKESENNVKELKVLIDKYIVENKNFVINKIKDEQRTKI